MEGRSSSSASNLCRSRWSDPRISSSPPWSLLKKRQATSQRRTQISLRRSNILASLATEDARHLHASMASTAQDHFKGRDAAQLAQLAQSVRGQANSMKNKKATSAKPDRIREAELRERRGSDGLGDRGTDWWVEELTRSLSITPQKRKNLPFPQLFDNEMRF